MLSSIRGNFSKMVVGGIIGFIGFVFVFSGVFNPKATRGLHDGAVAGKVGDESIKIGEFNQELNRRIEFLKAFSGGKFSEDQIKAYRLKEMVFQELVRRKLMVQEARKQGLVASDEQVKESIREIPAFQKDGKFDLVTYKRTLEANQYSPGSFEKLIREDASLKQWQDYFRRRVHVSGEEARREFMTQSDKRKVRYVLLTPEMGRKLVPVSSEDVKKYLADGSKAPLLKSQFESRKETSFKGKSFEDAKEAIARELLAGDRVEDVRKATDLLAGRIKGALGASSAQSQVEALLKDAGLKEFLTREEAPAPGKKQAESARAGSVLKTSEWITRETQYLSQLGEVNPLIHDAFAKKSPIDPSEGGSAKVYSLPAGTLVAVVSESQKPDWAKFDSERLPIFRKLAEQKQQELYGAWLEKLTKAAQVERNPSVVGDE